MSNTIRWMIEDVQTDTNDIITKVHWRVVCWGEDKTYVDEYGETELPAPSDTPIPYDDLTEDDFWGFILAANNTTKEGMIALLEERMYKAMNPAPVENRMKGAGNLPWLNNDGTGV